MILERTSSVLKVGPVYNRYLFALCINTEIISSIIFVKNGCILTEEQVFPFYKEKLSTFKIPKNIFIILFTIIFYLLPGE